MKISKSADYALRAAVAMAQTTEPVTVAAIAARHRLPEAALAKVFQALVRGGIAHGTRGQHGGYRLVRPAAAISVLQIIELFDPPKVAAVAAAAGAPLADGGRLQQLFREIEETTRSTFASVSIETLAR